MARQIYRFLHGEEDVFNLAEPLPLDLQGWASTHPIFEQTIAALKPALIVEVGSWKGASAVHMARLLQKAGIDGEIVCIDTYLGSPEHWTNPEFRPGLLLRHGQPQLYYQFISNVMHEGLQGVITPFPISSTAGAAVLKRAPLRPDLVYIDAGHEYRDVMRDIELYWALLRPGGVLLGDDFVPLWHGVIRAASEFADRSGVVLQAWGEKWLMQKQV
jgi:predicted O-methyltransferase YrrM